MLRKILIILALMAIGATMTSAENYSVLICGSAPDLPFWTPDFWYDTYLMWEALYTFGWKDENVHVLFAHGEDWYQYEPPWERYIAETYYEIEQITDDSATYANVVAVFEELADVMTEEDFLCIFLWDHGGGGSIPGHETLCLVDSEMVDTVFAALADACPYYRRVICCGHCFSTGFCEELANEMTFAMSAGVGALWGYADDLYPDGADTLENEIHEGETYNHGEFNYHMINAMRLQTIVGNPLTDPDRDQNGLTDMKEVGLWTDSTESQETIEVTWRDDGNIGSTTYLNIPPYAPTGLSGQRIGNIIRLKWDPNHEWDLEGYDIYKRTYDDSTQIYSDWHLLAQTTDTCYADSNFAPTYQGSDTAWYKIAAVDSAGQLSALSETRCVPGVIRPQGEGTGLMALASGDFLLLKNYPDPFNANTTISYALPQSAFVRLCAYDIAGREIAVLAETWQTAGFHQANFSASDLPSGVYLYRLEAGGRNLTGKMLLLK